MFASSSKHFFFDEKRRFSMPAGMRIFEKDAPYLLRGQVTGGQDGKMAEWQ